MFAPLRIIGEIKILVSFNLDTSSLVSCGNFLAAIGPETVITSMSGRFAMDLVDMFSQCFQIMQLCSTILPVALVDTVMPFGALV